jgi:hypothetical protein
VEQEMVEMGEEVEGGMWYEKGHSLGGFYDSAWCFLVLVKEGRREGRESLKTGFSVVLICTYGHRMDEK